MYKQPKLFGKDEDGKYLGRIEQIETATEYDILDISNRKPNLWIFSLFKGYRQIGKFKINKPHKFDEGDLVTIKKERGDIIDVKKDTITMSNINEWQQS